MTGSGNDFVFFDARTTPPGELERPEMIARMSARGTGIGADGVVFLVDSPSADIGLRYYNADGSLAALCGNATLCTTNLSARLGAVDPSDFTIETGSGTLRARIRDGGPEFDFPEVTDVIPDYTAIPKLPGERRLGFVLAGVPHVVIQVDDLEAVDVVGRGRPVRYHASLAHGANVNFVAKDQSGGWAIRTYERGVENETLACGTGNVAAAILLNVWGEAAGDVRLMTRSGQPLTVRLTQAGGIWRPTLRGEGRLVFTGELGSV
jgi:diaminopimelate epimerase